MARNVPALDTLTFDNGMVVSIRKVSPMLASEVFNSWRRKNPQPEPPIQSVEIMGVMRQEVNWNDPNYAMAMEDYNTRSNEEVGFLTLRMMIKRGVECDVDTEMVAVLRADMEELGVTLDTDDKYVFVTNICATTPYDLQRLRDAIMVTSQPTPEKIKENIATFQSNIQE